MYMYIVILPLESVTCDDTLIVKGKSFGSKGISAFSANIP